MTMPLALVGYILWPGTPDKPNRIFLSEKELALAKSRLLREGHSSPTHFTWKMAFKVFTTWRFWLITFWATVFWNACSNSTSGGYLLVSEFLDPS